MLPRTSAFVHEGNAQTVEILKRGKTQMISDRSSSLMLKHRTLTTLAAVLAFGVGLPHVKTQTKVPRGQPQTPRVAQPQTPASSMCTGTVAGEWTPTQSTDGPLTISVRGGSARGSYVFRGRRRTLSGQVTREGFSGTWNEETTGVAGGGGGEFIAKFDPGQHTLELLLLVGGDLASRSNWSCKPGSRQPPPPPSTGVPSRGQPTQRQPQPQPQYPAGLSDNHDHDQFRTFDALPKEAQGKSLMKKGPRLPQRYNSSDLSMRVFVAGGWPIEIDYSLNSDVPGRLTISVEGVRPFVVALEPTRRNKIRLTLPRGFPAKAQVAKMNISALRSDGSPAHFRLNGLAMGERGVRALNTLPIPDRYSQLALSRWPSSPEGESLRLVLPLTSTISISVDRPNPPMIKPGVKPRQLIRFSLTSQSVFSNGRWELWRADGLDWVEVWQEKTGSIKPNEQKSNTWDGIISVRRIVSVGDHALQVTAWHGREEDNSWVVARADLNLTVIP
jgi:hypothetical protein